MISINNRIPQSGKAGRVKIEQDGGAIIEGIMSMADGATDPGSPWSRRTAQLLQADIRTLPIAAGNTVAAGDVVDVVGGEVQKTWQANPNEKKVIYTSATSYLNTAKINANYSIASFIANSSARVSLIDNLSGVTISTIEIVAGAGASNAVCERVSDSAFVVGYTYNNAFTVMLCSLAGTTMQAVKSVSVSAATTQYPEIVSLGDNLVLCLYDRSGLKAKVCTISGTAITAGTEYSLPSSTNASYISATRLPDDGSNRRVCVCYSDAGDGNKGKAVIATISVSNVVTWGTPVAFDSAAYLIDCCTDTGDVVVGYGITGTVRHVRLLSITGSSISVNSRLDITLGGGSALGALVNANGTIVQVESRAGGNARRIMRSGTVLSAGQPFAFNTGNAEYCTATSLDNGRFLVAYADGGNSNYGTATILTAKGDQIAGSFTNTSNQAIALQSGTSGQSIDIIFDGVAELPGITACTQITSAGVHGYAPQDGWLWVRPEWDAPIPDHVNGSYTGNNVNNRKISLGFTPSLVMLSSTDESTTIFDVYAFGTYLNSTSFAGVVSAARIVADGFTLPGNSNYGNITGKVYKFTAFR